jgi:glycosyltransferase involved in cell wall biosynthesis
LRSPIAWELVFVNDHSPDQTRYTVREIARRDKGVRVTERIG